MMMKNKSKAVLFLFEFIMIDPSIQRMLPGQL